MGLIEFLDVFPESDDEPLGYAALSELSGISEAEADELALTWEEWTLGRRLELIERLAGLQEDHAGLEFEVVFKKGLRLADPRVRAASLRGLCDSQDRSMAARFASSMSVDAASDVRAAAAQASSGLAFLASTGRLHKRDGERLCAALCGALERCDENIAVKRRALETLGYFGVGRAGRYIEAMSGESDPATIRSVLIAMGRTSDPCWLPRVTRFLDHFDVEVRREAVRALGEVGGEEHAPRLAASLDDQDLAVQAAAVASLAMLGGVEAMGLLSGARESPEPVVASAAREALSALASEEGLLEDALPDAGSYAGLSGVGVSTDDEYEAAEREGWSHLLENGRS